MYQEHLVKKGNRIEDVIISKIENHRNDLEIIARHKTKGVDIIVQNNDGELYSLEVKSANRFIKQFDKKVQKYYQRAGNFIVCPDDLDRADLFVFVITHKNSNQIFFIDKKNVKSFLKRRKKRAKRFVISINQLSELQPKSDLSYFI